VQMGTASNGSGPPSGPASGHTWPHEPQLVTVELRFTSQPSDASWSQSAQCGAHVLLGHTPASASDMASMTNTGPASTVASAKWSSDEPHDSVEETTPATRAHTHAHHVKDRIELKMHPPIRVVSSLTHCRQKNEPENATYALLTASAGTQWWVPFGNETSDCPRAVCCRTAG